MVAYLGKDLVVVLDIQTRVDGCSSRSYQGISSQRVGLKENIKTVSMCVMNLEMFS